MATRFLMPCPFCETELTATVAPDRRQVEVTDYDHACVPRDVMEEAIETWFLENRPDLESD